MNAYRPRPLTVLALAVLAGALLIAPAAQARPPYALGTGLVAYWKLDEASGTRADELTGCGGGGCDLTDNNTVGSTAGLISNAAVFVGASSESLSAADHNDLSFSGDFTIAAWVYIETAGVNYIFVEKGTGGSSNVREYRLDYTGGAQRFRLTVGSGAANGIATATTFGSPAEDTWYLVLGSYDATNDLVSIAVNNGAANTTSYSGGSHNSTGVFYLGRDNTGVYLTGRMDEVGLWSRLLTTDEQTDFYNAGVGCTHPFSACEDAPTETPTNTPVPPTATDTPVPPTNTPTNTPIPPTATDTPVPPTNTPTDTPIPPTFTPSNTPIPPTATDTPEGPTLTPSNTPIPPTATDTPIPPTATDTPIPPSPTNTPTDGPSPTPTDTPTITPTPDDITEFILPSGRTLSFEWRWRMGELAIFGALVVLIAFIAFVWLFEQTRREL